MKKRHFDVGVSVLLCLSPLMLYMMSVTVSTMLVAVATLCISIGSNDLHKLAERNRNGVGLERQYFWWPRMVILVGVFFLAFLFFDLYFY